MDPKLIYSLNVPAQSHGKTSHSYPKRKANIAWIEQINRDSLEFAANERAILLHTTTAGEKIYIQYPGKESAAKTIKGKDRKESARRPWDFRPKVILPSGELVPDLSFGHIWGVLFENSEVLAAKSEADAIKVLSVLFYRMAYMVDHKLAPISEMEIYTASGKVFSEKVMVPHPYPMYMYSPLKEAIEAIPNYLQWCGMSLEGFLFYNDLLAWNEDCKYYYRAKEIKKSSSWLNGVGRMNTLLTHLRFLGCCLRLIPLATVFEDFSRGKGVSPASNADMKKICPELID